MEFVYDRTQADTDRAAELNDKYIKGTITESELQEWNEDSKGALNASDLNRIEGNMLALADIFGLTVMVKQWGANDKPRSSDYIRILNNLSAIRNAWYTLSTTPGNPVRPLTHFKKWNDIERILHDINYTYTRTINSYYYCGEICAGEGIGAL